MNKSNVCLRGLALSAVATMLLGCNTVRGVGRDVERAGEVIQGRSAQVLPNSVLPNSVLPSAAADAPVSAQVGR
jgi:predicted small secreted protein